MKIKNLIFIAISSCSPMLMAGEAPVTQVIIREVQRMNLGQEIRISGVVQSHDDVFLSANMDGELVSVLEPGTRVSKTDVIAKVDDSFLLIELEEQELLKDRTDINVKYLEGEVSRLAQLEKSNMASQTQMAEITSRRDLARNDYRVAQTRIERLREQLKRTKIVSPVTGVIVTRLRQRGEFVRRGERVVRVVDPYVLEVRASVPLAYLDRLEKDASMKLKIGAYELEGSLRSVVGAGDETSQTSDIYIDFSGKPPHSIVDGQFAEVTLALSDESKSLLVPRDALVLRSNGNFVFKVNDSNEATKISVVTGDGRGEMVSVSGDLNPGDKVVVRGVERLQDGQTVSPVTENSVSALSTG